MLEKLMKSILKETLIMILKSHGADPSRLTDEHLENLWKISSTTEDAKRDEKIQEYFKAYIL